MTFRELDLITQKQRKY